MSDLVERLRLREPPIPLMREAAEEIDRLRAALREIRDYTPIEDIAARNIARRALEGK